MEIVTPDYGGKSDDELLRLALESDSLTSEASDALAGELKRRQLDSPVRLAKFSEEQAAAKHLDDITLGDLSLSSRGFGKRAYGRSNREVLGTSEEYDATVFAVVSYFPLVPLGTYRFSREQSDKQVRVLDKRPLDWGQVVRVWLTALAIVAAIPFALDTFLRATH
jgi:hypothetical protein